jgi:hypothetical protein
MYAHLGRITLLSKELFRLDQGKCIMIVPYDGNVGIWEQSSEY